MKLQRIFKTKNPIIGMVHFPPLFGYKDFPGLEVCLRKSLDDAKILEKGGVDAVMFENNYDIPHKEFVDPEIKAIMAYFIQEISRKINIPFGINVLWNDYKTALTLAKMTGVSFIRVPVFVDSVKTDYGKIFANPKKVLAFQNEIKANDVALFTDIHVKHAKMLKNKSISKSAREAVKLGTNALIITGKWTGDAPTISDLKKVRNAIGKDFPILIGSGATKENVRDLLKFADAIIIGTALKEGNIQSDEVNLKPWKAKISLSKTREFVKAVRLLSVNKDKGIIGNEIRAILFDMVGVLLFKKEDYNPKTKEELNAEKIEKLYNNVDDKKLLFDIKNKLGLSDEEIKKALTYVPEKYEKFEELWKLLPVLKKKYKLAVINNGNSLADKYWGKKFDFSIFDVFINSAKEGIKKPDPRIYLVTCKKLKVKPDGCLLLDDLQENIVAAKKLEIRTQWWKAKIKKEINLKKLVKLLVG